MKNILLLLSITLLLLSTELPAQEGQEQKKLPPENCARKTFVDVQHSALDLRFDWEKKQAFGTATITCLATSTIHEIKLDAALLSIHSVTLDSKAPLRFDYDSSENFENLVIHLDRNYTVNEKIVLVINYNTNYVNRSDPSAISGSFGNGLRFLQPTTTTPIKRWQVWSSGEPEANRYWYPCIETPADVRTTELTATVEKKFTVISNGNLISSKENKDGTKTFYYKADQPYANYLTSIVVGEYTNVKQQYQNIALNTYAYPDEKIAAEATTVRLPEMIKYFSSVTGMQYPYQHYTQVMVQDYPFPGLNGQHTATIISDNMIDSYTTHADFFYLWDGVEAAALASQWFGNLVTIKEWKDIWLSVGFSHYMEALFQEHKEGIDEYLSYYIPYDLKTLTLGDWANNYRHPIVTKNYEDVKVFTSDNYARFRGSLVLRMLRNELGDENFFKVIQKYVQSNAYRQVTTNDFQKAVEETMGHSYQWFFDQWIYQVGLPKFIVTKSYDTAKKQFTLTLKQTQLYDSTEVYPQVKYFMGKIKIELNDTILTIQLEPKEVNIFRFNWAAEPKLVNVDFQNAWIKEIEFNKSATELLYQLQYDKDVLGKWTAIDALTIIYNDSSATANTKEAIRNAFRNTAAGNDYWRLRNYALGRLNRIFSAELNLAYDETFTSLLLQLTKDKQAWIRTTAISLLGNTKDVKYAPLYISFLNDSSERVVNAAANALGKTKSPEAYDALVKLKDMPSWKSQNEISALNGLKELGDPRGIAIALKYISNNTLPRWWLATPVWDYPVAAAETLVVLGAADKAYPIILDRLQSALKEDDYNDIFAHVFLMVTLADKRYLEIFPLLKEKFKNDANAMMAVNNYEEQLNEKLKNN